MRLEIISREPREPVCETPLLFVHGTGHAAWCWDENLLPYLAERGFSAHAVSLRGHGASEGRERLKWWSVADYVSDVFQAASTLPKKPVIIGHSLGGLVALKYLEKYDAPAGVLFAPSPSEGMLRTGFMLQLRNPSLFFKIALKQDYAVMFATPELAKKYLFSADADDREVARHVARFGSESYRAALEMIYNLPKPSRVKAPLLILGAQNDVLVPPKKIEKTARVFNADCKIFPSMAHDLMLERGWEKVADFMIEWLLKRAS